MRHKWRTKDKDKEEINERLVLCSGQFSVGLCCLVTCTLVGRESEDAGPRWWSNPFNMLTYRHGVQFFCITATVQCPCSFTGLLAWGGVSLDRYSFFFFLINCPDTYLNLASPLIKKLTVSIPVAYCRWQRHTRGKWLAIPFRFHKLCGHRLLFSLPMAPAPKPMRTGSMV